MRATTLQQMRNFTTTAIMGFRRAGGLAGTTAVRNICDKSLFAFLLLAAITLILHHDILRHPFCHLDDPMYVTDNQAVLSGLTLDGVKHAFTDTYGFYHPVTWLSLMVDATIGKGRSTAFHATNLWFHILNSFLFYLLSKRLIASSAACLLGSVLFCVHPLSVESFVWISERKGIQATSFVLGALLLQLEKPYRIRPLVTFLYVCSFLSKPSGVLLPLWGWFAARNGVVRSGPFGGISGLQKPWLLTFLSAFAILLTIYSENDADAVKSSIFTDTWAVGADILVAAGINLCHFFAPVGLAPYYPRAASYSSAHLILGASAATFLLWCLISKGATPLRRLAVCWIVLTYIPACGAISIGLHLTADRYLYLPMLGIIWLLIDLLDSAQRRWLPGFPVVLTVLSMALGLAIPVSLRTANRWGSEETLWRHTIKVTSSNYMARIMLGLTYADANNITAAIDQFAEATRIKPSSRVAWQNLAESYLLATNVTAARECYEKIVLLDPDNPLALIKLGNIYSQSGDPELRDRAGKLLRRAVCLDSASLQALDDLSSYYMKHGHPKRAARVYRLYRRFP